MKAGSSQDVHRSPSLHADGQVTGILTSASASLAVMVELMLISSSLSVQAVLSLYTNVAITARLTAAVAWNVPGKDVMSLATVVLPANNRV